MYIIDIMQYTMINNGAKKYVTQGIWLLMESFSTLSIRNVSSFAAD
jgi:hypothetical protein